MSGEGILNLFIKGELDMLQMENIIKDFAGVIALDHVNFSVEEGHIHALVGENGAGKSTLMKVLSGVYPYGTYEGRILIDGKEMRFNNTNDSRNNGIAIIYQELMLYPELSIAENICLQSVGPIVSASKMHSDAQKWMQMVGLDDNPETPIKFLGVGKQQMVEIAKALSLNARLLILDEPTASLTDTEVKKLFTVLNMLRDKGVTCIYISHKLEEVMEISDEITVLRDGCTVGTILTKDATQPQIIQMMVGREMSQRFPEKYPPKQDVVALELKNFSVEDFKRPGHMIDKNVNLKLHYGEIVGLAGLMGAGRTELVNSLFGDFKGKVTGQIFVDGEEVKIKATSDAIKHKIGLVTEDRKKTGLNLIAAIDSNIAIASVDRYSRFGIMDDSRLGADVEEMMKKTKVKARSMKQIVMKLSGGNQQKVAIAKWLMSQPRIMIFDEPTRGIDVGAKYEIYCLLQELKKEGIAILVISSELPEVLGLSDRILVLREGEISAEFAADDASSVGIMEKAI